MGPLKEKAALFTFNTHTKYLYQIAYMRLRKRTCFQDRRSVSPNAAFTIKKQNTNRLQMWSLWHKTQIGKPKARALRLQGMLRSV